MDEPSETPTDPTFVSHRAFLWALAYRLLGSAAEADDMVQEAYLRSRTMPHDGVASERAYLSTVVTRLCLDHWKSARVRRERYVGPWLPEPVRTSEAVDPASISLAFLVLLESLTPLERAVYLLSEVFDYSHAETARIVERDEATCRQLLHRARERVVSQRPRFAPDRQRHRQLLEGFAQACAEGDLASLERLLARDVTSHADGGGKANAARRPVVGAVAVARQFVSLFRKAPAGTSLEVAEVNGLPTLLVLVDGALQGVLDIETDGDVIWTLRAVVNPDKLALLEVRR